MRPQAYIRLLCGPPPLCGGSSGGRYAPQLLCSRLPPCGAAMRLTRGPSPVETPLCGCHMVLCTRTAMRPAIL